MCGRARAARAAGRVRGVSAVVACRGVGVASGASVSALPRSLTVSSVAGTESSDALCEAFLEFYGYLFVSETLYEITTVSPHADAEGRWTWTLRLARYAGEG